MSALRSIGALAGGAAQGLERGVKIKNSFEEGARAKSLDERTQGGAKEVGQALLDNLTKAHYDAQAEFGKTFAGFLAPSPTETTNFTGAAAMDARQQPAAAFGGGVNTAAALAPPPPTPMITAMTQPRRVRPLSFSNDAATFNEE